MRPLWPHLRGLLVALHVAVITLMALPAPEGGMDRAAWQDPTVQDELAAWARALNAWGVAVTPQALEERLWQCAGAYMDVRRRVLRPFLPYADYCGTYQGWRMFVAPHRYPTALHIDVAERGAWRPVYVERHGQYHWLCRQLDSYRFRSVVFRLGWPGYEAEAERFARWVAQRAARDFPEARQVRVCLYKYRTPSPEEVRHGVRPDGEFVQTIVLPLGGAP